MFQPKYIKHAKLLYKGVTRFLHYKRDLLSPEKLDEILGLRKKLEDAIKQRDSKQIESLTKSINATCEKAMPEARTSEIAENIEVFFVSIIIALGIRTYIAQPFQIPTSSMQPTLNGIIAQETKDDPRNGILGIIPNFLTGTSRLNVVAPHDAFVDTRKEWLTEHQFFIFRPYCKLHFTDGSSITIKCPQGQLIRDLHLDRNLQLGSQRIAAHNPDMQDEVQVERGVIPVKQGQLLARGIVRNGDHVIVNKFSYHFRKPTRGEVFVFTTKNIDGIQGEMVDGRLRIDPRVGSQHYIKRLVGVPGDRLDVSPPHLFINGQPSKEPGIRKVIDGAIPYQHGNTVVNYHGYSLDKFRMGEIPKTLSTDPPEYYAMGDNSYNSSDSRYWGGVPEQNLVGTGWFCYWPLTKHWGPIR